MMKIVNSTTLVTFVFIGLTVISCKENKQKVTENSEMAPPETQMQETTGTSFSNTMASDLFHNYQQLRLALVNSDVAEVQATATKIDKELPANHEGLKTIAQGMAQETDIEKQRVLFSNFTENSEPMFKEFLTEGKIYKQFCPMAFEGKGAYWVSNIEEIQNPYYGDKMLKCGKVVEVIQ